jgi:hypothetical protein
LSGKSLLVRPKKSNITAEKYTDPHPFDPWRNRRVRMFPIWFFEGYLAVTVVLFAFGPWEWPVANPIELYGFLVLVQIALWLGYKRGIKYSSTSMSKGRWNVDRLILISLIINLLWIMPNFSLRMGLQEISYQKIYESVLEGIINPGNIYLAKIKAFKEIEGASFWHFATMIFSPLLWLLFPLSIIFWDRLKTWMKFSTIVWIAFDLMSWIASGTNKGLADLVILLPWLLLARNPRILTPSYYHLRVKFVSLGLALFVTLLIFFAIGQYGRGGRAATDLYDYSINMGVDKENIVMQFLPALGQGAYASLNSYIGQGYYGLSLTLQEPFVWTYGVGNSYFLAGMSPHFSGLKTISEMTYPARIEKHGWDKFTRWNSIYPWLASDVTFPGVLLVVFLIGWLFAKVWLDVLGKDNPIAIALFSLLIIMLFYFPANNQVLAFSRTAIPFWVFLGLWAWQRSKASRTRKLWRLTNGWPQ